jgi:hypothetical protein
MLRKSQILQNIPLVTNEPFPGTHHSTLRYADIVAHNMSFYKGFLTCSNN